MAERAEAAQPRSRARERVVLVSDLHMSSPAGPLPDPFDDDEAFAALLGRLARGEPPTRLVLVGDFVDLVLAATPSRAARGDPRAALPALDAIAAAHPRVFEALGAFARAPHELTVVPGNHDMALLDAVLQRRFRSLVEQASGGTSDQSRIAFCPWIVHLPGVLYAEHGQQHHLINHFTALLSRAGGGGPAPPPAACLDEARVELAHLLGASSGDLGVLAAALGTGLRERRPVAAKATLIAAARAGRVARAGGGLALGPGRKRRREHDVLLRDHAEALELPADAVVELERRAAPTPPSLARLLAARAPWHKEPVPASDEFLLMAARDVANVLSNAASVPPFLVFGHSHIARDRPLWPSAEEPRYLNPGTWSSLLRAGRDGSEDRRRFVEIEHGGGRPPAARLRRWDDDWN